VVGTTWSSTHPARVGPVRCPRLRRVAQRGERSRLLCLWHQDLKRAGSTWTEGADHFVVTDPGVALAGMIVMEGMLVRIPMIGMRPGEVLPARPRRSGRVSPQEAPRCGAPCRAVRALQGARTRRWIVPLLILVRGARGPPATSEGGRQHRDDRQHDPKAMPEKAGLGTSRMAAKEASTVRALKATAFPAVSIARRPRRQLHHGPRVWPPALERRAKTHHQKEGVIDSEARANIRAKLRAQIDTGVNFVVITSAPAATRRRPW